MRKWLWILRVKTARICFWEENIEAAFSQGDYILCYRIYHKKSSKWLVRKYKCVRMLDGIEVSTSSKRFRISSNYSALRCKGQSWYLASCKITVLKFLYKLTWNVCRTISESYLYMDFNNLHQFMTSKT